MNTQATLGCTAQNTGSICYLKVNYLSYKNGADDTIVVIKHTQCFDLSTYDLYIL